MAGGTKPVPHTRKAENFQEGAKKSRSKTDKQNSGAGNKGFAVATSSVAAITFIRSKKLRCHRKNTPIQTASAGPVLVMETQSSRQNPSPTQSEKSHIQSEDARERERAKRTGNPNIDQEGHRANVRQNTTRQSNHRSV